MNRRLSTPPPVLRAHASIVITPARLGYTAKVTLGWSWGQNVWALTERGAIAKARRIVARDDRHEERRNRERAIWVADVDYDGPTIVDSHGTSWTFDGRSILPTGPTPRGGAR